jgi:hypothetical protein
MKRALIFVSMAWFVMAGVQASAQEMSGMQGGGHDMQGMKMGGHDSPVMQQPADLREEVLEHTSSGTSAEPNSTPAPMLMTTARDWRLMLHGNGFVLDEQQSGPRGGDKFFSTNWFMGMAQHRAGPGTFTARLMLSLEPATVSSRQYPLLFQQGETAFGRAIVDGQHPHDFFMEIAALYDLPLGEKTLLSFYAAPVGDPAIGPEAYPHRASAAENPVAALGHHQQDSTHIASDVLTAGLTRGMFRVEASGFHGREPDEFRWNIDSGGIDSWSLRGTIQPGRNWSAQYSYARIASPEASFPLEDQSRMTASVMYNRPLHGGNWANTLLWGRTRSAQESDVFSSYLFESTLRFWQRNAVWTRIENVDRSNELLLGERSAPPPGFHEAAVGRVQAYTFGYDREFRAIPHVSTAIGAQITAYGVAAALQPVYGAHPVGGVMFVRFRLGSSGAH